MPQISPKRLHELETENARLREQVAALKANRWAAFTDEELPRLTTTRRLGSTAMDPIDETDLRLRAEIMGELARREGEKDVCQ